ncbi:ATP-binding protein [Aeromonas jandaei]|uniref:BbrUII/HgiDII family restriction enzyme n=1 Tax=Aeromonas jandaei TaxID=650 RepID=UPI003B9FA5A0
MSGFPINIDINVLNHLGMGLYSNTPAVLTEIISNAWDAGATKVQIELNNDKQTVTITDDGVGMSENDIRGKFLNVGYARRAAGNIRSEKLDRPVMGRKGIGKLAMFSLANKIKVTTHKENEPPKCFEIDVEALKNYINKRSDNDYEAVEIPLSVVPPIGTKIELSELSNSINRTESFLRKRIARRFSIIGSEHNFQVSINGTPISISDRDYFSKVQLLWEFGESQPDRIASCKILARNRTIDNVINYDGTSYEVKGYIASVDYPSDLKDSEGISNNSITIISNGRILEEDVLASFGSAKVFTNYLVGEVEMNFLDINELPDMATSSRQQMQQNDPRYPVLKAFFDKTLSQIDKDWDTWRTEIGTEEAKAISPILSDWYDGLKDTDKKAAQKLLGKINTCNFHGTKKEQDESKREVLKNTLISFEKFRVKNNLEKLTDLNGIDSAAFVSIFGSIDDIEASLFHDITSQRLKVVEKFREITDENQLEKVVQEYIYDHLWLLDPSWDRVSGERYLEQTLTKELKRIEPDAEKGARVDIAYKTISGKHLIIELKRPKVKTDIMTLVQQGRKYKRATEQWYKENPNSCPVKHNIPPIEVIFLLGSVPTDSDDIEFVLQQLKSINGTIMTYKDLIAQSEQAYFEYLQGRTDVNKFKALIDSL